MGYLECEKCGGRYELQEDESLDDFESCECGGKLRYVNPQIIPVPKERIRSTSKILIGIIIVLVLTIGITAGMILTSKEPVTNVNNTTNNSTVNVTNSGITTTNTTSDNKNDAVIISAQEAEQIATKKLSGYDVRGTGASLSEGNGHPVWIVYLKNSDGSSAGQCAIDATTGEFLG